MNPADDSHRRFEPWAVGIATGLGLGMTVLTVFAWVAMAHAPAVLPDDPWQATRAWNRAAERGERARARGWEATLRVRREGDRALAELELSSRGEPLPTPRAVTFARERPAEGALDARLVASGGPTRYTAELPLPRAGRWRIVADVDFGDARLVRSLELRP